jgi:type I restriction enzyme S subunit
LFEEAEGVEARIEAGTNQTAKIAQAVLAKAFAGELVETEADLVRREGREYESASVLLKRIAVQREVAQNGRPERRGSAKVTRPTKSKKAT